MLEDGDGPCDRFALGLVVVPGVVTMYQAVYGQLGTVVRIAPEHVGMARQHARRGRPCGTGPEALGDRAVALEAGAHCRHGRAEPRQDGGRARGRSDGAAPAEAHDEAHARPGLCAGTDSRPGPGMRRSMMAR